MGADIADGDVCRALAMSGGGNNGAWEVGVIYGLVNNGDPKDFEYDVVSGVSAGAMSTLVFAGWEKGTEKELAQWGSDLWKNMKTSDIWIDWPLGKVSGATIMPGLLDDSPLYHMLEGIVKEFTEFKRRIVIAAVDVGTGEYTQFTNDNIELYELPHAAVSSASIPGAFPHHIWRMGNFMDGGTTYNINMEGAIQGCKDLGYKESQIVIDVMICGTPESLSAEDKSGNSLDNFLRRHDLRKYWLDMDSTATSIYGHPEVDVRYVIKQSGAPFSGKDELNFAGDFTWSAQLNGREDGENAIKGTHGANVKEFINEWHADETVRASYPRVGDYVHSRATEAYA